MRFGGNITTAEGLIETSSIVAIVQDEPERNDHLERIRSLPHAISPVARVEAAFVLGKMFGSSSAALTEIDGFLNTLNVRTLPFDEDVIRWCAVARDRYGKGSGSKAQLNLGDCFSYAFAARYGLKLLYKGNDFAHTDLA